tara:strand:+ start:2019 stop:6068 length:4050 start_codon:yes stop_codon:yes gene_type:complete
MAEKQTIIRLRVEGTSQLAQLKNEILTTENSLKQAKQQFKDGKMTQEQFAKASVDAGIKLKAFRGELQRQTKDIVTTNQKLNLAKGSYAQLADANKKASVAIRNLSDPLGKNKATFDKLSQSIANNTAKMKQMDASMGRYHKNVGNYSSGLKGFALQMGGVMIAVQGAIMAFRQIERVIGVFADFEFAIKQVGAISGATETELKMLEESARDLGASTAFTATEVAGLQKELAKLGFDPTEIENMTASVLDLAFAFGDDLSQAAEQTGFVLKMFDLDAEETVRVNDVMAAAFSNTALDLEKFSTAMPKVGAVAKQMGFSFEDTTALLGLMANAGFEASTAGTSLRNIFLKMADPAGELAQQLGYGITSIDQLAPALEELKEKGVDVADALEMTDKRSAAAFLTMLDGADTMEELQQVLINAEGTAASLANTMRDTLKGDIDELKSAAEGAAIDFIEQFAPALRLAADAITMIFQAIGPTIKILKPFIAMWATYRGSILAASLASKAWEAIQLRWSKLIPIITSRTALMNAMANLNPYVAIGSAIAGIAVAVSTWSKSLSVAEESAEKLSVKMTEIENNSKNQRSSMEKYMAIAKDETASTDDRMAAIDTLNEAFNDLGLTIDNVGSKDIDALFEINLDNSKLEQEIAGIETIREDYQEQVNFFQEVLKDGWVSEEEISQGFWDSAGRIISFSGAWNDSYAEAKESMKENQAEVDKYTSKIEKLSLKIAENKRQQEESAKTLKDNAIKTAKYANTLDGLGQKVKDYQYMLNQAVIGSREWSNWLLKLNNAKAKLKETQDLLNTSTKDTRTRFEKLGGSISDLEKKIKDYMFRGKDTSKLTAQLKIKQEKYNKVMKEYKELMVELGFEMDKTEEKAKSLDDQLLEGAEQRANAIRKSDRALAQSVKFNAQQLQLLEAETLTAWAELDEWKKKSTEDMNKLEREKYNDELKALENNLKDRKNAYRNFQKDHLKDLIKQKENEAQLLTDQITQGFEYTLKEVDGVTQLVFDETKALDDGMKMEMGLTLADLLFQIEGFRAMLKDGTPDAEEGSKGWLQKEIFGETEEGGGLTGEQFIEMIDVSMQQVMGIMSAFNDLRNTQSEAERDRLSGVHDQEVRDLKNSAEYELATEENKDKMLRELEHEQAMAMWKIDSEQFKQQKSFNKKMAIMEGAMAIMRIWASPSALPEPARSIMNGILTAAQVAMTGIQIATINAQAPPPMPVLEAEFGAIIPEGNGRLATGGMVEGPSHKEGGVKFGVGGRVMELEGGEAVINKKSTAMFRGSLSAMNVAGGGKKFATGGVVLDDELKKQSAMVNDFNSAIESLKQDSTILVTEAEITNSQRSVQTIEAKSSF